jgi:hypothetical protein
VVVAGGGRRIEDFYDIREEIGRGTCGRVHVALHRKTGEAWAVKVRGVFVVVPWALARLRLRLLHVP